MKKSKIIIGVIIFFLAAICFITNNGKIVAQEKETGSNDIKQQVMLMESLYLIKDLKLTEEQVKELIPLIKEAKAIKEEMDSKKNAIETQICDGLRTINDELAKNIDPSDEVFAKLRDLKKDMKSINEPCKEKAEAISDKVNNILTEEQKNIINNYRPADIFKGEEKNRPEDREKGTEQGKKMKKLLEILDIARNIPDSEYKVKKDELLAKVSERMSKGNMSWSEIEAKISKVSEILDKTRTLKQEEFETQKDTICSELVSIVMGSKKQNSGRIIRLILNPDLLPVLEKRI
ncbi:MAG: hypothetical protein ABRQ37_15355 [Candidatus Eremiobacterota bacterium]